MKNNKSKLMVSLNQVNQLKWSSEKGRLLSKLRGKTPIRTLAEKVGNNGISCSYQYIQKMESGKAESVSTEVIIAICNSLDIDFKQLFPGIYLDISELAEKNVA